MPMIGVDEWQPESGLTAQFSCFLQFCVHQLNRENSCNDSITDTVPGIIITIIINNIYGLITVERVLYFSHVHSPCGALWLLTRTIEKLLLKFLFTICNNPADKPVYFSVHNTHHILQCPIHSHYFYPSASLADVYFYCKNYTNYPSAFKHR